MTTKTVQALLDDVRLLGGEQYNRVQAVRALIRARFPSVRENVKYGGILCTSEVRFCGVFAYRQHVSVEFLKGAYIADALGHLEGGGKHRRHLKIHTERDIEAKDLDRYLVLAWEAARGDA